MKKFKIFFDKIREEKWMNDQLQEGYYCTNINQIGIYSFSQSTKNYVIRLDYQKSISSKQFSEYTTTYEDFGWEHIRGSRFSGIQYWQKTSDNLDTIFSDRQSYASYYRKIMTYSISFTLLLMIINYMMLKDNNLYATAGLWDMNGSLFWKAFIFETPFVVIKLLPSIMGIFSLISFSKAYKQFNIAKE